MGTEDALKNIITVPALNMPNIRGLGSTFFYKMLQNKDEIAQICGITGQKETFGFLLQKCIRTAIKMRSEGLTHHHLISICSFNNLHSCVPYLAGLFLDMKTASLDPTISLTDTIHLLQQINPKLIFVGPEAVELIEVALIKTEIDAKIVVFGETTKHLKFLDFLDPSPEEKDFIPIEIKNIKDTAVILFSSGTTGLPKGICLSHFGLLASFYQNNIYTRRGDITLAFSSMYWISSTVAITHSIMNAASRLIYPTFDPNKVWNLIKQFKVTMLFLAPYQILTMCKNEPPEGADLISLKFVLTGGGPLSGEQILEIRKCLSGIIICKGYGQTEISGAVIIFRFTVTPEDLKLLLQKPDSCGKVIPGNSCKIVDPETETILGPYKEGELRVKSEIQMNGYYNIDSSSCWDSEGYLKTGDIAYYDEDNCFYIVDRIKEMLKFQSWHVPPAKIETVLLSHTAIQTAVVVGISHPEDGDHPMGIVVLKKSAVGSVTSEEIEKYVEERVDDRHKLRGGVKIVNGIPLTPTGKINRRQIKNFVFHCAI